MNNIKEIDIYMQKAQECLVFVEKRLFSHNDKIAELIKLNQQKSDKIYCSKSTLRFGYFDPCPVEDIIVGKSKRGKLSEKMPSGNNFMTYYFDNNILTMAEDGIYYYVYDYYDADKMYILSVPKDGKQFLTLNLLICEYEDGKIRKITNLIANNAELPGFSFKLPGVEMSFIKGMNDKPYIFDFTEKLYSYSDERIESLAIVKIGSYGKKYSVNEYRFIYKGDYYSSYFCNGTRYRIKVKRKYNEFCNMQTYPYK